MSLRPDALGTFSHELTRPSVSPADALIAVMPRKGLGDSSRSRGHVARSESSFMLLHLRVDLGTILWAVVHSRRAFVGTYNHLQDLPEQQRSERIAGLPIRPYLHHSTSYTSLSRSGTDFQPRHLALIFRESPVDNYVWGKNPANRDSRRRSQTVCLALPASANDGHIMYLWHHGVMDAWHQIALSPQPLSLRTFVWRTNVPMDKRRSIM